MALSNMQVYNEYIMEATIERVAQRVEAFNQASNGAIVLSTDGFEGSYFMKSKFKSIGAAFRRVNRDNANATVAPTPLEEIEGKMVKVAGGATIIWEPSQLSWLKRNEAQAISAIAEGVSDGILGDQLNTILLAGVAAIGNNAGTVLDGSAAALGQSPLNASHALFGDRSQSLITQVMTGAAYHRLIGEALTNANTLFSSDTVTVLNILGKAIIVTDSPALYVAGTPNEGGVLSLVAGGLIVNNTSDIISNIETSNGKARIETTHQVDYTYGAGVKGYAWDEANGGSSPDDAALGTGTNWDKYATSDKDTAGVLLNFDADK